MRWRHLVVAGCFIVAILLAGPVFSAYAQELPQASDPKYENSSNSQGKFYGTIRFKPAADQSNITDYALYFLDKNGNKLHHIADVNVKQQEEAKAYTRSLGFDFTDGYYLFTLQRDEEIDVPEGAAYVGIYSKNASGESESGVTVYVWDFSAPYVQDVRFTDTNPQRGKVEGVLTWSMAADRPEVKGFLITYFDGSEQKNELAAPYGRVEAGKSKYEIPIAAGMLPSMAHTFYVQPLTALDSGDPGPGATAYIVDNITADTEEIKVKTPGVPVPERVEFSDTDPRAGIIAGKVSWEADDGEFMDKEYSSGRTPFVYSLYFLDETGKKIGGIASIPRDFYNYGYYDVYLPDDLAVPNEAHSIGVFLQMAASEGVEFGKAEIRDDIGGDYYAKQAMFTDDDPKEGKVNGKMTWQPSDKERDLKGYALFAGEETKPFATVDVGSKYEVELPEYVAASGHRTVTILPMDKEGRYLRSTSFQDARVHITDNMLAETKLEAGKLDRAESMFGSRMLSDGDVRPGYISGVLKEGAPVAEGTIRWYFYNHKGERLAPIGKAAFRIEPNRETVAFVLPEGTKIPAGAVYIGASIPEADGKNREIGVMIYDRAEEKASFSDIPQQSAYAIKRFAALGVIAGYNDGTFRPQQTVTRAQFASMVVRAFRLPPQPYKGAFKDVKAADWYAESAATAVHAGLLQGYEDDTFRPNQTITRKEMYMMIYRIFLWRSEPGKLASHDLKQLDAKYSDWDQVPEWLYPAIDKLKWYKLLPDADKLEPDRPVDREECALMLYKLITGMYS